jgi:predicted DNA-binding transcriptional regulator AlpA
MLSGGRFPRPDLRIGRLPKWKPSTVTAWIDAQSRKAVRR